MQDGTSFLLPLIVAPPDNPTIDYEDGTDRDPAFRQTLLRLLDCCL